MTHPDDTRYELLLEPDFARGQPFLEVKEGFAHRIPSETLGLSPKLIADVNVWVKEYEATQAAVYPVSGSALGPLRDLYDHSARGDELVQRIRAELGPAWQVELTEGRLFRPSPPPRGESAPTYYLDPDHPEARHAQPLTVAAQALADRWDRVSREDGPWAQVHLVALDDRPMLERAWGRLEASGHPEDELPNQTVKTRQEFEDHFRLQVGSDLGREILTAMLTRWMAYTSFAPVERARKIRDLIEETWQLLGGAPRVRTDGAWLDEAGNLDLRKSFGRGGLTHATFESALIADGNGFMFFVIVQDED